MKIDGLFIVLLILFSIMTGIALNSLLLLVG